MTLIRGDAIEPEAVRWLWHGYLAKGKLHLICGTAGDGKTTVAISLAATITRGGTLPDGSHAESGSILIWSGEDSIKDTLLPRFIAAGGVRAKLHFAGDVTSAGKVRAFDPAVDMGALIAKAQSIPDLALVVIDPVVSAISGDGNAGNDVRRGLGPLVALAETCECAVLGITHFRKNGDGSILTRVAGSLAYGAAARVVMATARKEAGEDRMLVRGKSNLGPDGGGFLYALEQVPVIGYPTVQPAQRVRWLTALEGRAEDIVSRLARADGDKSGDARVWLLKRLDEAGGSMTVAKLKELAEEEGRAWRTVRRAKETLKLKLVRAKEGHSWSRDDAADFKPLA